MANSTATPVRERSIRNGDEVIYLSGKMTGVENYGYDEFNHAASRLRKHGYVVLNPAETAGGVDHLPREWYFRFDFAVIATCDSIVALPNWRESQGAKAEIIFATEIGLPVYEYNPTTGRPGKRLIVEDWDVTLVGKA